MAMGLGDSIRIEVVIVFCPYKQKVNESLKLPALNPLAVATL